MSINCQLHNDAKGLECQSNQSNETSVEEGQIFGIYIARQLLKRHPENVDKRNSRARTEIIVNVDIGTVIKVKMRRKTLPSIAMCEACHAVRINQELVVLNKNGHRSCLNSCCWCISRLSCCCVLLVGWTGRRWQLAWSFAAVQECAKHIWHHSLLFEGRSLVVTLSIDRTCERSLTWCALSRSCCQIVLLLMLPLFVRCGWIPAWELIDFIMVLRVFSPSGALQNHTLSSSGLKLLTSLSAEKEHLVLDLSVTSNSWLFSRDIWDDLVRKISVRQTCPRHLTGLLDGFSLLVVRREIACWARNILLLEESSWAQAFGVSSLTGSLFPVSQRKDQDRTMPFFAVVRDLWCPQDLQSLSQML